ncbi:hypothetical protein F5Y18DRAFT_372570 [Xylariaceae sp. FL1019]|nr:hypothetical protein F5Y18DRAFT_372570 [Xylariaceae sp. FL1019]
MDHISVHFPSPDDTLSHEIHHPSRRPSESHFRIAGLSALELPIDNSDPLYQPHLQRLNSVPALPIPHHDFGHLPQDSFERDHHLPSLPTHLHRRSHTQTTAELQQPHHVASIPLLPHTRPPLHSPFGTLPPIVPVTQPGGQPLLHSEDDVFSSPTGPSSIGSIVEASDPRPHGQLVSRVVIDPPNLQAWRDKLFDVDDTITLTNDEFETYFPHIDNVYSHRSTQKYKRKNFISHYWDCRMKGRPPGTPKSEDPSKKKRKRFARERDLCDVKIKITEHFPNATFSPDGTLNLTPSGVFQTLHPFPDGTPRSPDGFIAGEKYWTIQRVNGNGGNGKGDGIPGPHKHTLEKSDEIKKSTVQRILAAQEKEAKKNQKSPQPKRPSGNAMLTAKRHSKEHGLKLYAASFCPFSQRVWIALEAKGMQYQYCETDPFKRPTHLLEANPRGMTPAIREGDWASGESTVILEYLEDHDRRLPLLPTDPRLKANCRLWIDHINAKIVPAFFALMRAQEFARQQECIERLRSEIMALTQAADERGPYFLGSDLCLVDIHVAPFALRMSRILRDLRNWSDPMPGTRWHRWSDSLEQNPHIQATTSSDELYVETIDTILRSRAPSTDPSRS